MSKFNTVWVSYERMEEWLRGGFAVRRRATPKFWLLMILTTVVVFSVSIGVLQVQYNRSARNLKRIREYRDELDLRARDLSDELAYAETDDFIIRKARDELGLIMPNEVRYVNGAG